MVTECLLGASDPSPVEMLNGHPTSPVALVCEHAGNAVPRSLHDLGLMTAQLEQHVAIDIGAAGVARQMAGLLNAPLLLQNYSRLVIDCNRPPSALDAMPAQSHGINVPGNAELGDSARTLRINELFTPYDAALKTMLEEANKTHAFAIHSFTPTLEGKKRPWDIGLLFRHDTDTSSSMSSYLKTAYPDLCIGLNQPYQIDDESDWFVPQHAERLGLNHSLIEIRNDLITTADEQKYFAAILAETIEHVCPAMSNPTT